MTGEMRLVEKTGLNGRLLDRMACGKQALGIFQSQKNNESGRSISIMPFKNRPNVARGDFQLDRDVFNRGTIRKGRFQQRSNDLGQVSFLRSRTTEHWHFVRHILFAI